jgi:hypothetical protein
VRDAFPLNGGETGFIKGPPVLLLFFSEHLPSPGIPGSFPLGVGRPTDGVERGPVRFDANGQVYRSIPDRAFMSGEVRPTRGGFFGRTGAGQVDTGFRHSDLEKRVVEDGRGAQQLTDGFEGSLFGGPENPERTIWIGGGQDGPLFLGREHPLQESEIPSLPRMPTIGKIDDIVSQVP